MYHGVTQTDSNGGRPLIPAGASAPDRAEGAGLEDASPASESEETVDVRSVGGDGAKKERVLHTRVPAVLERELKRFADNLRVPVSNLVRTILEDALQVADAATENVEERLKRAAKHLEKEREKLKKRMEHDPLEGIEAFQEVTLAVAAVCAKCERELPRGTRAHLGIPAEQPLQPQVRAPRRFVCQECLPRA
jgi:hypothetical protein